VPSSSAMTSGIFRQTHDCVCAVVVGRDRLWALNDKICRMFQPTQLVGVMTVTQDDQTTAVEPQRARSPALPLVAV